jgi:hypothetical protein
MKKLIFVAIIGMLTSVAAFRALHAPAVRAAHLDGTQPQAESPAEKEMLDRQAREANKKRQEDIRNDTEKLFRLASELKAAVDKSNEHLLSLEVIRKADEVEKLAKRVKDKMRESIGPLQPGPPQIIKVPQPH